MNDSRKLILLLASTAMMALASCGQGNSGGSSSGAMTGSSLPGGNSSSSSTEADSSKPAPTSFVVAFNYNYVGSRPSQVKVGVGQTVARPADPVREGYGFAGWYTEIALINRFDFSTPIVKNTVLFAKWDSTTITVSYNFNYVGAPAIVTQTVAKGSILTPIEEPTRDLYAFVAWCTDQAGEHPFDFTVAVQESITLFAKWSLSTAVVTLDLGYETEGRESTVQVAVGTRMEKPTDPTRLGYEFKGWYLGDNLFDFNTVVSANITLVARWDILVFTVTFNYNDGVTPSTTQQVNYGDVATEVPVEKPGFLTIWTYNDAEFDFDTPITADITLVATYQAISSDSYDFTFYWNYIGAPNNGVYEKQTVAKDDRATRPTAPSRDGCLFAGWYTDAACTSVFVFTTRASANTSIYAKWLVQNRFEAEYVNLDGKPGHEFSGNMSGTDLIFPDNGTGASNGYYVSGLYYEEAFIEFDITADRAVDDAVVVIAVQCEWDTKTFNPDLYQITVNGVSLDYDEFTLEGYLSDSTTTTRRPFIEVELNDPAVLNKGVNVVKMITANNVYHGGTRQGDAPMIDYLDIYTDATLTWSPRTDNLDNK